MGNAESQSSAVPVPKASLWRRVPMGRVIVLVVGLLLIGEQFPFSYFPMYSSFDPVADYYYVTDKAGQPLACVAAFGTSTANVKKMFRARLRALMATRGATEADATTDERRRVGVETIAYLRHLGEARGTAVPAGPVRLMRVVVTRSPGKDIEREEAMVAEQ